MMTSGLPYLNTYECWKQLIAVARDALYLELVPAIALEDRRNPPPALNEILEASPSIYISEGGAHYFALPDMPHLPSIEFERPRIAQWYQVEIWVEKTTINDIVMGLGANAVVTGIGELSAIRCRELVDRTARHKRPTRILYVSDFDPGGMSMPVAVARKIEFELYGKTSISISRCVRLR